MNALPGCRAVAVAALALALAGCQLFGPRGDPLEGFRDEIRRTVPDAAREREMLAIVDRMETLIDESFEVALDARREEQRLFADYGSTRADYRAVLDRIRAEQSRVQAALVDAEFELRAAATADEWATLTQAKAEATERLVTRLLKQLVETRGT